MASKQTVTKSRRSAKDLIAQATAPKVTLTKEQRDFIAEILKHNDVAVLARRVNLRSVHRTLRDEYGFASGADALERLVCAEFGRKSWGKP